MQADMAPSESLIVHTYSSDPAPYLRQGPDLIPTGSGMVTSTSRETGVTGYPQALKPGLCGILPISAA